MDIYQWFSKGFELLHFIVDAIFWFVYHWYLWVFIHVIAYRTVRKKWTLESDTVLGWAFKYIGLSFVSSGIYVLMQYLIVNYSGIEKSLYILNRADAYYFQLTFSAFSTYWAVIGVGLVIDYYKKYKMTSKTALELKAELAETNLNLLKMQLQPHFVFNTLNTIVSLIYEKPSSAENMVVYLSDFLRKTLQFSEKHLVSMNEELSLLHDYINIIQLRYENQILIEYDIDESIENVPNLILQPLIENAIVHNIFSKADQVNIRVEAYQTDQISLSVVNTCTNKTEVKAVSGKGHENIKHRLKTLYGDDAYFEARTLENSDYEVIISFPNKMSKLV